MRPRNAAKDAAVTGSSLDRMVLGKEVAERVSSAMHNFWPVVAVVGPTAASDLSPPLPTFPLATFFLPSLDGISWCLLLKSVAPTAKRRDCRLSVVPTFRLLPDEGEATAALRLVLKARPRCARTKDA